MDGMWKWLATGVVMVAVVLGVMFNMAAVHKLVKSINPDPVTATPPPPDMSGFIPEPEVEVVPPDGTPGEVAVGKYAYAAGRHESEFKMAAIPPSGDYPQGDPAHPKAIEQFQIRHGQHVRLLNEGKGAGGTWYLVKTVNDDWSKEGWIEAKYLKPTKPKDAIQPEKSDWLKERAAEEEKKKKGSILD